jgi:energy-coupling factor transporter ATP-binding protein EcfA2
MAARGDRSPAAGARVRARGWTWRHAGRTDAALSNLNLDIAPGERVLLLGASGAGKSTLLQALAGVLGGDEEGEAGGELLVDHRPPAQTRGRSGLVLQDPDSQVVLARIGDDVAFGCENLGVPRGEIWPRVTEALRAVGLDLPLDHPTTSLSGGQKQKLALAGVLAMRPGLLLLDEPTANLDPDAVTDVRDAVVRSLDRSGATLMVIEHRVAVWQDVVNRVIVLGDDGGVIADGPTQEVFSAEGERLAAAGVWVPAFPPRFPVRTRAIGESTRGHGAPLLRTHDLAVGRVPFARREAEIAASGIELSIKAGTATMITGPNGAGKSTLALTLAGLLAPARGVAEASAALSNGIGDHPWRWRSAQLLTRIGTVFQDPEHQFLAATVREELTVGPRALGLSPAESSGRVDELLQRLRLEGLADVNPFTLSGGQKRRLSVGTVLATRPRVLVLDEPTFGQDSRTWEELVALFAELLDEGSAIVAVTHDQPLIDALADVEYTLPASAGATPHGRVHSAALRRDARAHKRASP